MGSSSSAGPTDPPASRPLYSTPDASSFPRGKLYAWMNTSVNVHYPRATSLQLMRDFLHCFQNDEPVDRAHTRYQKVVDAWERGIQAIEESTTDELARDYFCQIAAFYNHYYPELYGFMQRTSPPSSTTVKQPTNPDSLSNTLGPEAVEAPVTGHDIVSKLTDDIMSHPDPTSTSVDIRRGLYQDMMHFSESRGTMFGPAPNPARAHEMPATRHLPTIPNEYVEKEDPLESGRDRGSSSK